MSDYEPTPEEIESMREAASEEPREPTPEELEDMRFGYQRWPDNSITIATGNTAGYWNIDTDRYLTNLYSSQAAQEPENRTVFVAYPYAFPEDDYRGVFAAVGEELDVTFTFADAKMTRLHILVKIDEMMREAAFSLFDVTTWNPNVALELGLAYGRGLDFYVLFNPTVEGEEVLSDLRGIDRVIYRSYAELGEKVRKLVEDQFGVVEEAKEEGLKAELEAVRQEIPNVVKSSPGIHMGGIASAIGLPVDLTLELTRFR